MNKFLKLQTPDCRNFIGTKIQFSDFVMSFETASSVILLEDKSRISKSSIFKISSVLIIFNSLLDKSKLLRFKKGNPGGGLSNPLLEQSAAFDDCEQEHISGGQLSEDDSLASVTNAVVKTTAISTHIIQPRITHVGS